MKRLKATFSIVFFSFMIIGCTNTSSDQSKTVLENVIIQETDLNLISNEFLDRINLEHESVVKPEIVYDNYIHSSSDSDFNIQEYQRHLVDDGKTFNGDNLITIKQVKEDIDFLFQILQTTYGGYYYFGGDLTFNNSKEMILQSCSEKNSLNSNFIHEQLIKQLNFIEDGHFRVMGQTLSNTLVPVFYKEISYIKTDEGYETLDTKNKVVSVEGWENLDDLFKPSISEEGQLVYYPVVLLEYDNKVSSPSSLKVTYEDESTQILKTKAYKPYLNQSSKTVDFKSNEEYPLIYVPNMGFDETKDDVIGKDFLKYAEQLRHEPVLIIDLRSNGGGNGAIPFKWFETYTNQAVTTNYVSINYLSLEDLKSDFGIKDNPFYVSYETCSEIIGFEPISDRYMKSNAQPDAFIDNKNLLVILTSKNTASAAEMFVDMAHNVRNTLVIGENTCGMLVSGTYTEVVLPNSKITIQLGSNINLFPEDNYFNEYVGFKPDLWVEAINAKKLTDLFLKELLNK